MSPVTLPVTFHWCANSFFFFASTTLSSIILLLLLNLSLPPQQPSISSPPDLKPFARKTPSCCTIQRRTKKKWKHAYFFDSCWNHLRNYLIFFDSYGNTPITFSPPFLILISPYDSPSYHNPCSALSFSPYYFVSLLLLAGDETNPIIQYNQQTKAQLNFKHKELWGKINSA